MTNDYDLLLGSIDGCPIADAVKRSVYGAGVSVQVLPLLLP